MIGRCLRESGLLLALMLIAAVFSSFSLSFIPLTYGDGEGKNNIIAYAIAIVFWLGLILMLITLQLMRKKLSVYREELSDEGIVINQQLPGIVNFSFQRRNIALYAVTAVGLCLIISDIIFNYISEVIMFPIISVTILSFAVHCVVDGKCYKVYKLIKESEKNETNG